MALRGAPPSGEGAVDSLNRERFRAFVAQASPTDASDLTHRFFTCLRNVLTAPPAASGCERGQGTCVAASLVVCGSLGTDHEAAWTLQCTVYEDGLVTGTVHERAVALESLRASNTARLQISSFQLLLDIAARRTSMFSAISLRRLVISGNVRAVVRQLSPALSAASSMLLESLPAEYMRAQSRSSGHMAQSWMPDTASRSCPICKHPWRALIRRRHHCRTCGTLVCANCSVRGMLPHKVRQCIMCINGTDSSWSASWNNAACSASRPTTRSWANSDSTPSMRSTQGGSRIFDLGSLSTDEAKAPPEKDTLGFLLAKLDEVPAQEVKAPIVAVPPSERERQMWEHMLSTERKSSSAETPSGFWLMLSVVSAMTLRLSICVSISLALFVTTTDSPSLHAAGESLLRCLPRILPRIYLCVQFFALIMTTRLSGCCLFATLCAASCWRWLSAYAGSNMSSLISDGSFDKIQFQFTTALSNGPPVLVIAATAYPIWATICAGLTMIFLLGAGLRRGVAIYLTAAVPIGTYWACRTLQRFLRLSDQFTQEFLYDNVDAFMAPFITNQFMELGGLFVKIGQWASNVSMGVPVTMQESLKKLVDCAGVDGEKHIRRLLRREFGKEMEDIFEEFDLKPLASASIAQVHRAKVRDGNGKKDVAVKIQHNGIEPLILSDLKAFKCIVSFCCWLGGEKWADTKRMVELWARDMVLELDFEHEVQNLRQVRAGIAAAGVDVVVPEDLENLVSRRVLTMTFCDGFRFTDKERLVFHGVDRTALGSRALHAAASQLLEIGVCNSDPHAGNLLCQVRGDSAIPVLLDFGNCIRLTEEQRLAYCKLLVGVSEASVTTVRKALDSLGLVTSQSKSHPERDLEFMMLLFRDTGSRKQQIEGRTEFVSLRKQQKQQDLAELGATSKKEKKQAAKKVQRFPTHVPDEFILFIRMMSLVRGLCTQLDAELPFLQIFEWHARRALIALTPQPARAFILLPLAEERGPPSVQALRSRLRATIAQCCAERTGLGVQVCVHLGKQRAVDECGGVLGSVDPRPMTRHTPIPLAELSRLPLLLAVWCEVGKGRLSYSKQIRPILEGSQEASQQQEEQHAGPTLGQAFAHRALASREGIGTEARAALVSSSAADLADKGLFLSRVKAAVVTEPEKLDQAAYLPLGLGTIAAAALETALGESITETIHRLPGAASFTPREVGFGIPDGAAPPATLSSSLLADMRTLSLGSAGGTAKTIAPMAALTTPSSIATSQPKTSTGSIMDALGGLLVDPALAGAMVEKATAHPATIPCPDLSGAASARALAAVMAAVGPSSSVRPVEGCEPQSGNANSLADVAGLAPRAWDERGLQVFETEANTSTKVVGLTAAGGMLGIALQWKSHGTLNAPVTVVALSNELSLSATPCRLVSEVCRGLGLPLPLGLPG